MEGEGGSHQERQTMKILERAWIGPRRMLLSAVHRMRPGDVLRKAKKSQLKWTAHMVTALREMGDPDAMDSVVGSSLPSLLAFMGVTESRDREQLRVLLKREAQWHLTEGSLLRTMWCTRKGRNKRSPLLAAMLR